MRLYDMHCHLDFFDDLDVTVGQIEKSESTFLSSTVTPQGYERAARLLTSSANVYVALGLHPWWIADGSCNDDDFELFEALAKRVLVAGEVGLDFGKRHAGTEALQREVFERVARSCAEGAIRVMSIHAVKAEDETLEMLKRMGCLDNCSCIMHWFSGSSEQLMRAIEAGCYFSVGPRMLASKRGREYVKAIPRDRLLLETDAPSEPHSGMTFQSYERLLEEASMQMGEILGQDIHQQIERTSAALFGTLELDNQSHHPRTVSKDIL